jgi:uncharacterized membrane protein
MLDAAATSLSTLFTGLLAGVFLCSGMVEHSARRLGAENWIGYKQSKERLFGPVMPVFFGVGLLVSVAAAFLAHAHLPFALASFLLAAVLAVTVAVHVPLNRRIQGWSAQQAPEDWNAARRRWRDWNVLRCVLAVAAFCLVAAAVR